MVVAWIWQYLSCHNDFASWYIQPWKWKTDQINRFVQVGRLLGPIDRWRDIGLFCASQLLSIASIVELHSFSAPIKELWRTFDDTLVFQIWKWVPYSATSTMIRLNLRIDQIPWFLKCVYMQITAAAKCPYQCVCTNVDCTIHLATHAHTLVSPLFAARQTDRQTDSSIHIGGSVQWSDHYWC